ncbi:Binding partner of ACD11 1 [Zea mays]|uniref:Binding partner of ACD11 1 n=2 Tax=Zea mays TaxID=4577 RepID=C4JA36_MAIZE|nr:Binding partner of ACD11 1 [Zea mays]ACR38036.1 unknown [Zea mays]AQL02601.1 Binding partner of ACD11 1 [Zea mays]PWZ06530.1 Binding partner of ACD11 1 [Zea mays]
MATAVEVPVEAPVRTVKVTNVSLSATVQDIKEFFSFSGDIDHVEMQSGDEWSQVAYVTFKDAQGAETALLLSGATIVDLSVIIAPAPEYQPPPTASAPPMSGTRVPVGGGDNNVVHKAEDVVSTMLAKGFVLGKDAVGKAKAFDEKHGFTSTAGATVASIDKKIGLTDKITTGTSLVSGKVKEMDQKFQVSDKTKSALAAAEQKVSSAGSAIMKNRYVFTGASWVTSAFNKVAKTATDVGTMTKEKMAAEEHHKGSGPSSGGHSYTPIR